MAAKREVTVNAQRRFCIPAEIRGALAIEPGDTFAVQVEDDHILLIPSQAIKRRLWDLFKDVDGSMSQELILERRRELLERDFSDLALDEIRRDRS